MKCRIMVIIATILGAASLCIAGAELAFWLLGGGELGEAAGFAAIGFTWLYIAHLESLLIEAQR